MRNVSKGILAIITYFLMYFVMPIIFNIIIVSLKLNINSSLNLIYNLFTIVCDVACILIIVLLFDRDILKNFKDYKSNIKQYLSKYIKYWFLALALMYATNIFVIAINGDIAQNEQEVRTLFNSNPILTFILASLIAPVLEELVFRFSIYKIIGKYKWLFIIISGLAFGGMHVILNISSLSDLLYLIPYSIPGIIFAYTLVKSENIFVPISLHCIHNTFALVLQMIATIFSIG